MCVGECISNMHIKSSHPSKDKSERCDSCFILHPHPFFYLRVYVSECLTSSFKHDSTNTLLTLLFSLSDLFTFLPLHFFFISCHLFRRHFSCVLYANSLLQVKLVSCCCILLSMFLLAASSVYSSVLSCQIVSLRLFLSI